MSVYYIMFCSPRELVYLCAILPWDRQPIGICRVYGLTMGKTVTNNSTCVTDTTLDNLDSDCLFKVCCIID